MWSWATCREPSLPAVATCQAARPLSEPRASPADRWPVATYHGWPFPSHGHGHTSTPQVQIDFCWDIKQALDFLEHHARPPHDGFVDFGKNTIINFDQNLWSLFWCIPDISLAPLQCFFHQSWPMMVPALGWCKGWFLKWDYQDDDITCLHYSIDVTKHAWFNVMSVMIICYDKIWTGKLQDCRHLMLASSTVFFSNSRLESVTSKKTGRDNTVFTSATDKLHTFQSLLGLGFRQSLLPVFTSWIDKITNWLLLYGWAPYNRSIAIPPKPFRMSSLARAAVTSLLARCTWQAKQHFPDAKRKPVLYPARATWTSTGKIYENIINQDTNPFVNSVVFN